jgi:hypothetical protein
MCDAVNVDMILSLVILTHDHTHATRIPTPLKHVTTRLYLLLKFVYLTYHVRMYIMFIYSRPFVHNHVLKMRSKSPSDDSKRTENHTYSPCRTFLEDPTTEHRMDSGKKRQIYLKKQTTHTLRSKLRYIPHCTLTQAHTPSHTQQTDKCLPSQPTK